MGRPQKSEQGPIPTRERIFQQALELFATQGYDAVSVRDITRALNLNEATLYIHYKNKAALLEEILERLQKTLIEPGFRVPPAETFSEHEDFDLAEYLIEGAAQFFSRADRTTLLTWRMLMISQYRFESARTTLEEQLLGTPLHFFTALLENMQSAGLLRRELDCSSAGRIIAALFFDYSFRSNLKAAWNERSDAEFSKLKADLKTITAWIEGINVNFVDN